MSQIGIFRVTAQSVARWIKECYIKCRRDFPRFKPLLRYHTEYFMFEKMGGKITHKFPIVTEYNLSAGVANGHYFHQDLLVASLIFDAKPKRHIDIGSRIDGFVAHVASFRKIEVMDIRHLGETGHENISFIQRNLMNSDDIPEQITDSISSLHVIEHFGLGRYGDPIDPNGHIKGFNNILKLLKPNGILYISFPIGNSNEIHFNAHRIFHPKDIFNWVENKNSLELIRFDYVDNHGNLHKKVDLDSTPLDLCYGCGIYTFKKLI